MERLYQLARFGKGPCLERMRMLLARVAPALPSSIKITGSNGKGSTAAMTSSILTEHGQRCGLFTSPHLYSIHERIQIDGTPISRDSFESHLNRVLAVAEEIAEGEFSRFEILLAVAASWFTQQNADAIVWEAGIGGRLDATRIPPGDIGVLTQVALEHTSILGNSLVEIAHDKADIVDPGCPVVVGPLPTDVIEALTLKHHLVISKPQSCGLHGQHQRQNAGCAYGATQLFLGSLFKPKLAELALKKTYWPGRMEKVATHPAVWIDTAHNVTGLEEIRKCLPEGPLVIVFGVSYDRPVVDMAPILVPFAAEFICTSALHKGTQASVVAEAAGKTAIAIDSLPEALDFAIERASAINGSILVTGGLFLAAESAYYLRGNDPSALRFL